MRNRVLQMQTLAITEKEVDRISFKYLFINFLFIFIVIGTLAP